MLFAWPVHLSTFPLILGMSKDLCRSSRLTHTKWRQLDEQTQVFDPDGVARLWSTAGNAEDSVWERLIAAGCPQDAKAAGLIRAVVSSGVDSLSPDFSVALRFARLEEILSILRQLPWVLDSGKSQPDILDRILCSYSSDYPSRREASAIRDFVTERYGDPRWDQGSWYSNLSEIARSILDRLFTTPTLLDFFKLVHKTSNQQWPDREEFWTYYVERGYVDEAWPVLGPDAVDAVERGGFGKSFGKLRESGDTKRSVILMRCGDLILAEGSHDWSLRIWLRDEDDGPQLRRPVYHAGSLWQPADDKRIGHYSGWQSKAARLVNRYTGLPAPTNDSTS